MWGLVEDGGAVIAEVYVKVFFGDVDGDVGGGFGDFLAEHLCIGVGGAEVEEDDVLHGGEVVGAEEFQAGVEAHVVAHGSVVYEEVVVVVGFDEDVVESAEAIGDVGRIGDKEDDSAGGVLDEETQVGQVVGDPEGEDAEAAKGEGLLVGDEMDAVAEQSADLGGVVGTVDVDARPGVFECVFGMVAVGMGDEAAEDGGEVVVDGLLEGLQSDTCIDDEGFGGGGEEVAVGVGAAVKDG